MNGSQQVSTPEGGDHRSSPMRSPSPKASRRGMMISILPEQGTAIKGSSGAGEGEGSSDISE